MEDEKALFELPTRILALIKKVALLYILLASGILSIIIFGLFK